MSQRYYLRQGVDYIMGLAKMNEGDWFEGLGSVWFGITLRRAVSGWALAALTDVFLDHDDRTRRLLEANNEELEKRRAAEAEVEILKEEVRFWRCRAKHWRYWSNQAVLAQPAKFVCTGDIGERISVQAQPIGAIN